MHYEDGKKIPNKWLSEEDLKYLMSLKPEDLTVTRMYEMLAITEGQNVPRFLAEDVFVLKREIVPPWNKTVLNSLKDGEEIQTTVGTYIFNLFVTEMYGGQVPYWNENMTGGDFGRYQEPMAELLMLDKVKVIPHYGDYCNHLGFLDNLAEILIPSDTYEMLQSSPAIKRKIKEVKEKYKDELLTNPASAGAKIEREVLTFVKEQYANLDTARIYEVGDPTFGNDLKNMSIMTGPQYNNSTKEWEVSFSNFADGIRKDELALFADIATNSGYLRSVGTGTGGDFAKRFMAASAHIKIDNPLDSTVTDCGSTDYTKVLLTPYNKLMYMYRYMKKGKELIELTPDVMNEYIGQEVRLRYLNGCTRGDNELCMVCTGGADARRGFTNIGLTSPGIASTILTLLLKAMHNTTVKLARIDPAKYATRIK